MNILVTGGAGFIGSHVVDAYIQAGHNVVVIDDLSSGSRENLHPKATFYPLDIRDGKVEEIFRDKRIDVLNHLAAQMDVRRSVDDPSFDASVNVLGGVNLFECARKHSVKKIIFSSTGGALYGEQDEFPADEDHPTRPLSPYGITKLTTEKYLFYYGAVYNIDYVVLRYANVYGPRQNPHGEAGVVAIFCSKLLRGEQPIINGEGKQTRDYVFVGDAVRANLLALGVHGSNVFNVGTGVENDVNTVFRVLRNALNPSCKEHHGPAKLGEQLRSVVSYRRIERELGWTPTVSLEEGLQTTAEYFKTKHRSS
ncbi:MAG: NAD-dependent epimerase/dehydratase family protein [Ignavibacteriales bacterium]|nr:NAD-dependent epimerase/dehydratase family protein [Ignavibacteriales bacterium]